MEDRDKRDYFRLPDTILVEFQHVTEREADKSQAEDFFTSDPNFHLLRDIYELQLESRELQRALSEKDRQLGGLMGNLEKQIELLAKTVVQAHSEPDGLTDRRAEISEGGLSFLNDQHMAVGQSLALRLLFKPSCLGLACFAEVRHCQLEENEYRIGVRFRSTDYRTQRLISRHIISKQAEQRRARLHEGRS